MTNIEEIWKDVPGHEGLYRISNLGRVKSLRYKGYSVARILRISVDPHGYQMICLTKDKEKRTKKIHKLVAIAFLGHEPCGHKLVVNHKDLNKLNNNLSNLELVSSRINGNKKHLPHSIEYTGVSWNKKDRNYECKIMVKGVSVYLGRFKNEIDAHYAYENKLKSLQ